MPDLTEITPDYPNLTRLDDRHIVVLGGGLGIGRQVSIAAASVGANVTVIDVDPERAAAVAGEVGGLALSGDATNRDEVERIIEAAEREYGPVHGFADIIGMSDPGQITEISDEIWQRGFDLNLRHAFLALQIGSRAMTEGGSIVFVGSIAGLRSSPNRVAYGAAKAALMNLAGTAAVELGPDIRVNVVAPGQIATPRVAQRHPDPDYYDQVGQDVPLKRVGEPRDIASAILYFLSDLSQWVTGQTLVVDGGTGRKFQYTR